MTTQSWISAQSQQRPTKGTQQVWCYDLKAGVTTGYFQGWRDRHEQWHDWWMEDGEHDLEAVTHWQPLSRPPQPDIEKDTDQ